MNIKVDYREHSIIDAFKKLNFTEYVVENLIIGDFIVGEIIIERKSVLDLSSSIIDNRFREQKERLLQATNDPSKIMYIIEGNKKNIKNLSKKIIDGAIINLIFKHQYKVLFTIDILDTAENLISLFSKIKNNDFNKEITPNKMNFIKKADKINENILTNMLSVIPGVSILVAQKLFTKYNSMQNLLANLTETSLMHIQITDTRKIGKSLALKIYNALITIQKI
jgi:ERCC4-type nuclease